MLTSPHVHRPACSKGLDFASIHQVPEGLCPTSVFRGIVPIQQDTKAELIVPGQLPAGRVFLFLTGNSRLSEGCWCSFSFSGIA